MITRLLVANRGEIAKRIFVTCHRLGIETVAVHSPVDAELPYVAEADYAVALPGNAPADSYLRVEALINAARLSGADAIHPGYGFLAENADFARAVLAAGLTWVGPTPESIEAMGDKVRAKALMRAAGVPVLDSLEPEAVTEQDLPVLVKAAAGGGGRGMRVVRSLADLPHEIDAARAEAESAFGDGTVFVEPYVEYGRHLEVQVVGDRFGALEVFGERDCSLQRRHQKVIEETPAPLLPEETRAALHDAARSAAGAVGYRGAGTVEFLYDPLRDSFYFLEMNTRLQVEHPVTELVHGVDLVALQLGVAEGEKLSALHDPSHEPRGHAIEVRLYAEDPAAGFRPQTGRLAVFDIPADEGIRVDAGFAAGNEVTPFYDAMLAKVICHASTRAQAVRQLTSVLRRSRIHGVTTNRDLLVTLLGDDRFRGSEMFTGLLDYFDTPTWQLQPMAPYAATVALIEADRAARTVQRGIPVGWRNVLSQPQRVELERIAGGPPADGDPRSLQESIAWIGTRNGIGFPEVDAELIDVTEGRVRLLFESVESSYDVVVDGDLVHVHGPEGASTYRRLPRFTDPATQHASGSLLAPMPGTVVAVRAAVGDRVDAGQPVIVLEAMKMQHTVVAPDAGTVIEIDTEPGRQVAAGEVLAVVQATDATEGEQS